MTLRATLGELLKRYPDLFPKPLDQALEKMWGYASDQVRALSRAEGVDFDAFAAWLDMGIVQRSTWLNAALQVVKRDARPMKALLARYKQARSASDERVPEGVQVHRSSSIGRQGAAYIHITAKDGKKIAVSVATAKRMGLIK